MSDGQALRRPVGWWLKEVDALLDAAFDSALSGTGMDRRGWQILTTLATAPTRRAELLGSLASFDSPEVLDEVLERALKKGWVEEAGDALRLSAAGRAQQQAAGPRVEEVRSRVSAAMPQEDYVRLISLLARLAEGLRSTS